MPSLNKFGYRERIGCLFLTLGLLFLFIFNIAMPGLIPYADLAAYLFLVIGLPFLAAYSKIFRYILYVIIVEIILKSLTYLLIHQLMKTAASMWIFYIIRILDFGILFLISAAVNQYSYRVKNCELSEKCDYTYRLIIWLAVVIFIFTFRINIIRMLHLKGLAIDFITGAVFLTVFLMPLYSMLQFTGLIKAFKKSLKIRSYIDA